MRVQSRPQSSPVPSSVLPCSIWSGIRFSSSMFQTFRFTPCSHLDVGTIQTLNNSGHMRQNVLKFHKPSTMHLEVEVLKPRLYLTIIWSSSGDTLAFDLPVQGILSFHLSNCEEISSGNDSCLSFWTTASSFFIDLNVLPLLRRHVTYNGSSVHSFWHCFFNSFVFCHLLEKWTGD